MQNLNFYTEFLSFPLTFPQKSFFFPILDVVIYKNIFMNAAMAVWLTGKKVLFMQIKPQKRKVKRVNLKIPNLIKKFTMATIVTMLFSKTGTGIN